MATKIDEGYVDIFPKINTAAVRAELARMTGSVKTGLSAMENQVGKQITAATTNLQKSIGRVVYSNGKANLFPNLAHTSNAELDAIKKNIASLTGTAQVATTHLSKFAGLSRSVTSGMSSLGGAMRTTGLGFTRLSQSIGIAAFQTQILGYAMTTFVTGPLAGLLGAGVKAGVKFAADFEQASISLKALAPAGTDVIGIMTKLRDVAVKSPAFDTASIEKYTSQMIAAGLQVDKAVPLMQSLSNVFVTLGVAPDQASEALFALSQMMSKGKVTGEELNRQFANAIPGGLKLFEEAAHHLGFATLPEMVAATQDGTITMNQLMQSLIDVGNSKKYLQGAAEGADTLRGAWENLKENVKTTIGMKFLEEKDGRFTFKPEVKKSIDDLRKAILGLINNIDWNALVTNFTKVVTGVSNLIDKFNGLSPEKQKTIEKIMAALILAGPAAIAVGYLTTAVSGLTSQFGALFQNAGTAIKVLAGMGPTGVIIGGVTLAVAALTGAIILWIAKTKEGQQFWEGFKDSIGKGWNETIKPALDGMVHVVRDELNPAMTNMNNSLGIDSWTELGHAVGTVVTILASSQIMMWTSGLLEMKNRVDNATTAINALKDAIGFIRDKFNEGTSAIKDFWNSTIGLRDWISANVIPIFQSAADTLKNILQPALNDLKDTYNNDLKPAFQDLADTWNNNLKPAWNDMVDTWNTNVKPSLGQFNAALHGLADALGQLGIHFHNAGGDAAVMSVIVVSALSGITFGLFLVVGQIHIISQIIQFATAMFHTSLGQWRLELDWTGKVVHALAMDFDLFVRIVTGLIDFVMNHWRDVWNIIVGIFNGIVNTLMSAWQNTTNFFVTTWHTAGETIKGIFHTVSATFGTIISEMKIAWNAFTGTIMTIANRMKDGVVSIFWDIVNGAVGAINALIDLLNNAIDVVNKILPGKDIGHIGHVGASNGGLAALAQNKPHPRAMGGPINGPGTSTSDSIHALLSNGEYVIRADSVKALGQATMDHINQHGKLPATFATGGFVGSQNPKHYTPGMGRAVPGGVNAIVALYNAMGGAHRPGSNYRPGDPLWHGSGLAVDFPGFNQDAVATRLMAVRGGILELIHSTATRNYGVSRGNIHEMGAQLWSEHKNHLHLAATPEDVAAILGGKIPLAWTGDGGGSFNPLPGLVSAALNKALGGAFDKLLPPKTEFPGFAIRSLMENAKSRITDMFMGMAGASGVSGATGGGVLSAAAKGWIAQALAREGHPDWQKYMETLVFRESGGNPLAKSFSSNGALGYAVGLAQLLGSTFDIHRDKSLPNDRTDPIANLVAAIRYIESRYKTIFNVPHANPSLPPNPGGYDNGGFLPAGQYGLNTSGKPEMVLTSAQASALERRITEGDHECVHYLEIDGKPIEIIAERVVKKNNGELVRRVTAGKSR